MPELPEVETIRRDLLEKVLQKAISKVEIMREKTVRSDHDFFKNTLTKSKFLDIDRIGKLLMFDLGNLHMLVHLKMTGQLIYKESEKVIAGGHSDGELDLKVPNNHTRAAIYFADGSGLFFNDMRVFGYLQLANEEEKQKIKAKYGIEPLTNNYTYENFEKALQNRKKNLKAVLLDQSIFSGIGNIYADEACFMAGVRPDRLANSLSTEEKQKLFKSIETVIAKAVDERGTTFNDYVDPYGRKGNFVNFLQVYGRGGELCNKCGESLQKIKVAGRGTVVCAKCQK